MERLKNFLENVVLWRSLEKCLWRPFFFFFFFGDRLKNFCEDLFFFGEYLCLCPWSMALASSIPVLGLESVCPRKGCPWPWPRIFYVSLALASSLVFSTPPLLTSINTKKKLLRHCDVTTVSRSRRPGEILSAALKRPCIDLQSVIALKSLKICVFVKLLWRHNGIATTSSVPLFDTPFSGL